MIDIKKIRDPEQQIKINIDFLKRDLTPLLEHYTKEQIKNLKQKDFLEIVNKYNNQYTLKLKETIFLDKEYRKLLKELEKKRSEKNKITREIKKLKEKEKIEELKEKSKLISKEIINLEEELKKIKDLLENYLLQLPNELDEKVPIGLDEEDNITIKINNSNNKLRVLEQNKELAKELEQIGFKVELVKKIFHHYFLEDFGYINTKKAANISQSRFYFELNEIVLLNMAITINSLNLFINEIKKTNYNYKIIIPPYMVRKEIEEGATTLDVFEEALYKIEGEDLYLIPTAEHAIAGFFKNSLLEEKDLPLIVIGFSPSFRKEAGSHGKDTKGIFRTHQFHKIELYSITKQGEDEEIMNFLINLAEKNLENLEIPYRKVAICSGDMDKKAKYQLDLEAWFPGQQKFRELGSYAFLNDWQSRRLNIKYLKNNQRIFANTVYATGIAIERTICALVENHYDEKKEKIKIPNTLKKILPIEDLKLNQ